MRFLWDPHFTNIIECSRMVFFCMGSTKVLFFESTPPYVVAILACKLTHHPWSEKGLSGLFVCFTRDFQFVSPIRGLSTYVGATFKPTWDDFGSDKFFLASFNHAFYGLSSYPKLLATCKLKTSRMNWLEFFLQNFDCLVLKKHFSTFIHRFL